MLRRLPQIKRQAETFKKPILSLEQANELARKSLKASVQFHNWVVGSSQSNQQTLREFEAWWENGTTSYKMSGREIVLGMKGAKDDVEMGDESEVVDEDDGAGFEFFDEIDELDDDEDIVLASNKDQDAEDLTNLSADDQSLSAQDALHRLEDRAALQKKVKQELEDIVEDIGDNGDTDLVEDDNRVLAGSSQTLVIYTHMYIRLPSVIPPPCLGKGRIRKLAYFLKLALGRTETCQGNFLGADGNLSGKVGPNWFQVGPKLA